MAIIFNGSPLFTGDAGSGESEIRRWLIESDLLEGIIALPENLFYNTGINTYIFVLSNRKNNDPEKGPVRKNKIQLVDAREFYVDMRKSLGSKRHEISAKQIEEVSRIYGDFKETDNCKIFDKEEFGYLKVRIERPLKLNFKITEDRIENIYTEKTFNKLFDEEKYDKLKTLSEAPDFKARDKKKMEKLEKGRELQEKVLSRLRNNMSDKLYKNRKEFKKVLKEILGDLDLKNSLFKAVLNGLSERDETADYCKKRGKIESDTDLRDYERVPLSKKVADYQQNTKDHVKSERENIERYFEEDVKPHVPDLPANMPKDDKYAVYVLKCSDGSLYKGQTNNLKRRLEEHRKGYVSWTSKRLPVYLVHREFYKTRGEAIKREKYLKSGRGRKWLNNKFSKKELNVMGRQAGAWVDYSYTRVGYEIPFTRYFYEFEELEPSQEIKQEIEDVEKDIKKLMNDVLDDNIDNLN